MLRMQGTISPCEDPPRRIFRAPNPALMKRLFLALLLACFATSAALADSPEAILKDYRKQAAQAVERLNQSLEKAATPLITKLVQQGDTAGAEELTSQLKAKIAGEQVATPQASAAQLFTLYDEARAKAMAPVQKSSIARIDSILKTAGGAKLETVTELGKVRAEIEAGKLIPSIPKSFLKKNNIAAKWGYYSSAKYDSRLGTIHLNEDGTLSIDAASPASGTWVPTSNPAVLTFDIKNAAAIPEKTEMIIKGKEATFNPDHAIERKRRAAALDGARD